MLRYQTIENTTIYFNYISTSKENAFSSLKLEIRFKNHPPRVFFKKIRRIFAMDNVYKLKNISEIINNIIYLN